MPGKEVLDTEWCHIDKGLGSRGPLSAPRRAARSRLGGDWTHRVSCGLYHFSVVRGIKELPAEWEWGCAARLLSGWGPVGVPLTYYAVMGI